MNLHRSGFWISLLLTGLATSVFAQKIKVGYDKSVDFSRYKSYTLAEPGVQPTRPLLYASIVGSIDHELTSKGFARTQSDGDLILVPAGGTEFGLNQAAGTPISPTYSGPPPALDATMWTGAGGSSASMAMYVPEGALELEFIDRRANKVVWSGTVTVKLDIERKTKSLELIDKSIVKLLKGFPPEKK
jgi:hypothetical protein